MKNQAGTRAREYRSLSATEPQLWPCWHDHDYNRRHHPCRWRRHKCADTVSGPRSATGSPNCWGQQRVLTRRHSLLETAGFRALVCDPKWTWLRVAHCRSLLPGDEVDLVAADLVVVVVVVVVVVAAAAAAAAAAAVAACLLFLLLCLHLAVAQADLACGPGCTLP